MKIAQEVEAEVMAAARVDWTAVVSPACGVASRAESETVAMAVAVVAAAAAVTERARGALAATATAGAVAAVTAAAVAMLAEAVAMGVTVEEAERVAAGHKAYSDLRTRLWPRSRDCRCRFRSRLPAGSTHGARRRSTQRHSSSHFGRRRMDSRAHRRGQSRSTRSWEPSRVDLVAVTARAEAVRGEAATGRCWCRRRTSSTGLACTSRRRPGSWVAGRRSST